MISICRALLAGLLLMLSVGSATPHALEPGYLEIRQLAGTTWQAFWRRPDVNGGPMRIDAALPRTCTPEKGEAPRYDGSAWVVAWVAECPDGLQGGNITILGLETQRTDVLVRIHPVDLASSTVRLTPDQTVFVVPAALSTGQVFTSYLGLGFEHILEGWDHLLFVFALLLLIRSPGRLVGAITAFTVAHSITLALAALSHVSVPGPPVEACIALSIVFLAIEVLKRDESESRLSERSPWIVSFSFGLLHGLGFAGALTEIGLPQSDVPVALLAFNVGVELGQLAFVAGVMVTIVILRAILPSVTRYFRDATSQGTAVMGYAVGCVGLFWLVERVSGF